MADRYLVSAFSLFVLGGNSGCRTTATSSIRRRIDCEYRSACFRLARSTEYGQRLFLWWRRGAIMPHRAADPLNSYNLRQAARFQLTRVVRSSPCRTGENR